MLPYSDSRFSKIALALFFCCIALYALFEARGMLFGPTIAVSSEVTTVYDPFVNIEGKADRITALSMNGKEISVTEEGGFSEPYLLAPGGNHIFLKAKDTYGRTTTRVINIVYVPRPTAQKSQKIGTSTSAT